MKKKRTAALFSSILILISMTSCNAAESKGPSSENTTSNSVSGSSSDSSSPESGVTKNKTSELINHMTEKERSSISEGKLSLIKDQKDTEVSDPDTDEHNVKIDIWDGQDYLNWFQQDEIRSMYNEEEYDKLLQSYKNFDENEKSIHGVSVDGRKYTGFMPPYNYDGGYVTYYISRTVYGNDDNSISESDIPEPTQVEFNSFDEFKTWYRKELDQEVADGSLTHKDADQTYEDMLVIFDSVINKTYEEFDEPISINNYASASNESNWEFDAAEVTKIKDSVKEISVYDEELDTTFIIHVTLPPDFDNSKKYPMFVMTDGVWRFGDHPALRKMMQDGEAEDVILVSISYDYSIDGTDNSIRSRYFCEGEEYFLNFITDNLMPYLDEEYNIDFERSALYGHSLGGTFTHYAVFNSDKYENQPFYYYIIGSPAFWSPLFYDTDTYRSMYGYFDRNDKLDKFVYVAGGENEDPDYEQYYDDDNSTLQGISALMKRLEDHSVKSAESKIYEGSNHYEYIPEMFRTFFLEFYKK